MSGSLRSAALSLLILVLFLSVWQIATQGTGATQAMDPEYAKLMGVTATQGKSAMPGPLDIGAKLLEQLRHPFYDKGPNDKGIGLQVLYSLGRVGAGYLIAVLVAIPLSATSRVIARTTLQEQRVATVAERWAGAADWEVIRVTTAPDAIVIEASGAGAPPDGGELRAALDADGLDGVSVRVALVPETRLELPGS